MLTFLIFSLFVLGINSKDIIHSQEESDCECIKWDQCSWFNDAFKRALEISKGIYQGVLSTGMVQPNLWYKSL